MATAYLHGLKKSDLTELAQASKLPDYEALKKIELESALDQHLRENQSTYANDKALGDYYKRLGSSRSPVKKEPVTAPSGDEAPVKKQRRKTKAADEITATASTATEKASNRVSALIAKTPSRQSISSAAASIPLPSSPAAVSDMVERGKTRITSKFSEVYKKSGVTEGIDETRALFSSAYTVQVLFIAIEAYGIFAELLPFTPVVTFPPLKYVHEKEYVAKIPDVFQVLKPEFWGTLTLWASTSFLLPTLIAYFINIAHSASTTGSAGGHATRRATATPQKVVDPLVFNIAKALLVLSVYHYGFTLFGTTSDESIETVSKSVLGGEVGMLTSTAIGALLSLYEAILKK
ncbi:hypothetical protein UCRPC4_g01954 [Phaeomoniella chlamydospora]|uniref:Uncharacterized protein n=1 Tax=Phaeomoniella chlamydospora TaxID=158046 RepID=A0A0G2ESR4_PHACM|nr:hypothetical protein UCRPC4_g01954 [Phaeomoniella chlamydospora]